ncbi:uncharacterized protein LOC109831932 isoform X2 [Asparagus officinalis]|uniref:uncharacterized protein LOC109831932 isoform X2 n=1 Tax=Asparagus officinalis TaxID=4686 RepID=UPI00098DF34E|nr:uncharacterized protein LOC109831932 isoform X2 [Asparagus officinalis]
MVLRFRSGCQEDDCLAVGLSDNSVALWDMNNPDTLLRVKSSERSLLYSMRIWGDSLEALRIASGTIYNEIIVWKLIPQDLLPSSSCLIGLTNRCTSDYDEVQFHGQQYISVFLSRLTGHEGSIFRIAWSSDGSRLMSVSDDRSARIWIISGPNQAPCVLTETYRCNLSLDLVLFGHNARIWDCYISESVVITAGEDCTCRLWGMDGKQLSTIKEHVGRGIWRCLYDPGSSLLVTAGFDSAIKVHLLRSSSLREITANDGLRNESKNRTETFTICAPKMSNLFGLMDSKSEYIRCLRFARENILYVATNNGYLYHVKLLDGDALWTEIAQVSKEAPIICMDIISLNLSACVEDIVAVGDGKGNVTVIRAVDGDPIPKYAVCSTWSAEKDRQLLGIYWCKSLGCNHLFTADPRGALKLWNIGTSQSNADNTNVHAVFLAAVFSSSFGTRIMSLDASIREEVLICGDQRGNLSVFPLSEGLLVDNSSKIEEKVPLLSQFKGAHGISCVTSVLITTLNMYEVEVHTTGGDGCICYFRYSKNSQHLEFTGMKQVKELSTIQCLRTESASKENLAQGNYAVGFMSADFIIWNLKNESKVVQVSCGGWRRPNSYYLGDFPEHQNCFAYLKDNDIHIHRQWLPVKERELIPKVLHVQYHGRETHSVCFISFGMQSIPMKSCYSCLATGCEDGTVRLTRYRGFDMGRWCESKLLGEHVGGSAVRSVYFVSKTHIITTSQSCGSNHGVADKNDNPLLLISVGAKQVLTSWLLQYRSTDIENLHHNGANTDSEDVHSPTLSMYFQWLSTHMPPKFASSHQKVKREPKAPENGNCLTTKITLLESDLTKTKKLKPKSELMDRQDNDWRYMAVTAFLVKHVDSRLNVCFVVVACSDATLMLRALLLPNRLWVDIATLVSETSPVLALQHLVIPSFFQVEGTVRSGNSYIIVSGSTDGSITFWDITETIDGFMQRTLELRLEMLMGCQRRPQTGRGSQGGRWWKSLKHQPSQKNARVSVTATEAAGDNHNGQGTKQVPVDPSSFGRSDSAKNQTTSQPNSNIASSEIHQVWPLHILNSVHQSGVNCLHVSERMDCLLSKSETYCLVSGGDDQAVNYLVFDLTRKTMKSDSCSSEPTEKSNRMPDCVTGRESGSIFTEKCSSHSMHNHYQLRVHYRDKVDSAHSSAVKGIWTDGIWAFSTGLDQRIRCWRLGQCGKLIEHSHLVVSVPEPEALDALNCGSGMYQIAVAGRGMQMAEFYSSTGEE